ncbi:MAG: ATP-grasp domain-containing protein [Candidatus Pacearchaeota archaeon]|nr:ATP-grasp domain-containing protein [Candidatus Pacearchaeota archaeon]
MEKLIIYHTDIDPKTATPDDLDVLEEAKFVSEILSKMSYEPILRSFNIERAREEIKRISPVFVFNLVEAINGKESLSYLAPEVFEQEGVPYTGCTKSAFVKTANKISAKNILNENGITTPYFLTLGDLSKEELQGRKFLLKSATDHASRGLEATLYQDKDSVERALKSRGIDFFAEEYIEGREFNISIIGLISKGIVLPIAEMQFKDWKEGKLKIVDYDAKWNPNAHEYSATVRNFDFLEEDQNLIKNLESICKSCWNLFDLRGYARVDFRVSEQGIPYVLEINSNPCISPDAGFIAAVEKAGMTREQIIRKIIKYSCNI